ncbi:hypothetical protein ACVMDN_000746 [Bradyrhizobium sp. USDA 4510]
MWSSLDLPFAAKLGGTARKPTTKAFGEAAEQGDLKAGTAVGVIFATPDGGADMANDRGCRSSDIERTGMKINLKNLWQARP